MTTETMDPAAPTIRDADLVRCRRSSPTSPPRPTWPTCGLIWKLAGALLAGPRWCKRRRSFWLVAVPVDTMLLPHLAGTKADLADLRTEIHAAMNALTWKLAGALLTALAGLAGLTAWPLIVALQIFA